MMPTESYRGQGGLHRRDPGSHRPVPQHAFGAACDRPRGGGLGAQVDRQAAVGESDVDVALALPGARDQQRNTMAQREEHPAEAAVRDVQLCVREEQVEVHEVLDQHVVVRVPGSQLVGADSAGHHHQQPIAARERLDRRDHQLSRVVVVDGSLRDHDHVSGALEDARRQRSGRCA